MLSEVDGEVRTPREDIEVTEAALVSMLLKAAFEFVWELMENQFLE